MKRLSIVLSVFLALSLQVSAQVLPPPVITDRSLLISLVATNLFGQNAPAIAATETQYEEMWAQDITAMQGYGLLSASVASTDPTIFSPLTVTADYSDSESTFTFTSGNIPVGDTGYELTIDLKSSTPNLQFDESEAASAFDLENDFTLIYSDGTNTSMETGSIQSYEVDVVPEPSTWAMLFCGIIVLAFRVCRRQRKKKGTGMNGIKISDSWAVISHGSTAT